MRLDQELVSRGLCESRKEAQECIEQSFVTLDGLVILKKTRQVDANSVLAVTRRRTFVSRGGDKLLGALLTIFEDIDSVRSKLRGRKAIDIGSSTGGFTDCLLSCEVSTVTAVDVGTAQFHLKLRNDPRVTLFENTDIRNFTSTHTFDIIVADLSFISLEKVLECILSFGEHGSLYFLLIKPQFEVGYGNTKKGIVKDTALIDEVLTKYTKLFLEKGLHDVSISPCTITGGDGNQEYFIHARK